MPKRPSSARPPPRFTRPKNRLLAGLPDADFRRLRPHLRTLPSVVQQVLHPRNAPITDVFFPNGGIASVTTVMNDGGMIEVATVGDEGVLGINAMFGGEFIGGESMMQVPDTSIEALPVAIFRREIDRHESFDDCIRRYSQGYLLLMMQSAGCLGLHSVHQRCCRWLLMTHDRVRVDTFRLSHEFLAVMIGSTRPTVSLVAGTLQKAGLIKYIHGRLTILDRERLEAGSCECYATVRKHFDRLGL